LVGCDLSQPEVNRSQGLQQQAAEDQSGDRSPHSKDDPSSEMNNAQRLQHLGEAKSGSV
jgi:hypothetical protein